MVEALTRDRYLTDIPIVYFVHIVDPRFYYVQIIFKAELLAASHVPEKESKNN